MIVKNRSEIRAREILEYYNHYISKKYSDYIESIILVGSLSNGSYIEGPGRDIDIITVLKETSNKDTRSSILEETDNIEKYFNNDLPIARAIYKLSELKRPFKSNMELTLENKHLIEVTSELQRIHESGILLYGRNIIGELPIPSKEEVMFFDELGKAWSEIEFNKNPQMKDMLDNPPINILVQIIITTAFRHYYYFTNQSCSNKHEIASKMKKDVLNYRFQSALDIATKYKMNPSMELVQSEYDEMKNEYKELQRWKETQPIDAVPLY